MTKITPESSVFKTSETRQDGTVLPRRARVLLPSSKSLSNRAILLAALCADESELSPVTPSDDVTRMILLIKQLGAKVLFHENETLRIVGASQSPLRCSSWNLGEAGTCARFVTAILSTFDEPVSLHAEGTMLARPMVPLLKALQSLGVKVSGETFPFHLQGPMQGGVVEIEGHESSQFLSALLMAAPLAKGPVTIILKDQLVSPSYVDMTIDMMKIFGVTVHRYENRFEILPSSYKSSSMTIPRDASAASFFLSWAHLHQKPIQLEGLGRVPFQSDLKFLDVLVDMGGCYEWDGDTAIYTPPHRWKGYCGDLGDLSDTIFSFAVVALFADTPSHVWGLSHVRHKESDRLAALVHNVRLLGGRVEEHADGLTIFPLSAYPNGPVTLCSFRDHRVVMAFSVLASLCEGIVLDETRSVSKSYPEFFTTLNSLSF